MATRALIRVIPRQEGLAYDQAHNHVDKAFFNIYKTLGWISCRIRRRPS